MDPTIIKITNTLKMKSYLSVAVLALLGSNVEAHRASMNRGNLEQGLMKKLDSIEATLKNIDTALHSQYGQKE